MFKFFFILEIFIHKVPILAENEQSGVQRSVYISRGNKKLLLMDLNPKAKIYHMVYHKVASLDLFYFLSTLMTCIEVSNILLHTILLTTPIYYTSVKITKLYKGKSTMTYFHCTNGSRRIKYLSMKPKLN